MKTGIFNFVHNLPKNRLTLTVSRSRVKGRRAEGTRVTYLRVPAPGGLRRCRDRRARAFSLRAIRHVRSSNRPSGNKSTLGPCEEEAKRCSVHRVRGLALTARSLAASREQPPMRARNCQAFGRDP